MIYHDKNLIDALVSLLESNNGYQISFDGIVVMNRLDDKRFLVTGYEYDMETRQSSWKYEEIFDNARKAAEFFEQKRSEHEIRFKNAKGFLREEISKFKEELLK